VHRRQQPDVVEVSYHCAARNLLKVRSGQPMDARDDRAGRDGTSHRVREPVPGGRVEFIVLIWISVIPNYW
ncbi:hypothetical protein ACFY0R_43115, partial [Streptomyces sp. NPDC001633]|uniref:hypothetical protein n=1 Tax=Streptomyces sp. NPDC001633 TaxID=3364595 RepID=UPI0036CDB157